VSSPTSDEAPNGARPQGVSRRTLFGAAGVAAAVLGAAGAGTVAGRATAASTAGGSLDEPVPFRGCHQAGIITAAQDRMHYCAFDITTDSKAEVVAMLGSGPPWPSG
jgi:deferrochelatase/peroxidase EfeB